ncbi:MAG TPA: TIGR01777 family oxidoreductase [Candidatus Tyrphobacter sp.]
MSERVALLGGSGFIGTALATALRARGDEVSLLSLRAPRAAAAAASACGVIVNLAGEPIAQRWTPKIKRRILDSRTRAPRDFLEALAALPRTSRAYVSASAIGYYGSDPDATFDETSLSGNDFLARVCLGWEREAQGAEALGMRTACVRTGLLLGHGGALAKMLPLFALGLGGRYGDGRQWYSWIHIDDAIALYLLAIDGLRGAVNATAPHPVRNADFAATLARALRRPAFLAVPAFALRLALGEGAQVILGGQRVLPKRAEELGFRFKFPELLGALKPLVV